ncbi:MAG: hypothetical protein GWP10_22210 [Nitrospiraceae bacterium]|nr:hypothetical protein [Nitrospiraceae bacterium]
MRVWVGGTKTWSELLKKALKELNINISSSLEEADVVVWFYGSALWQLKLWKLWFLPKKKIIIWWIGSDVLNFTRPSSFKIKVYVWLNKVLLRMISKKHEVKHVAVASWLIKELKSVGVSAELVPYSTIKVNTPFFGKESRRYDFVSYVPIKKWAFYGGDKIKDLALRMPNKKFLIISPDLKKEVIDLPKNINLIGKVSHEEFLRLLGDSSVLLRLTEHDGLSNSVLEALFEGCKVVWKYKIKGVKGIVSSVNELNDVILTNEDVLNNQKVLIEKYGFNKLKDNV